MIIALIDWETTGLTLHPDTPAHKQPRAIEFGGILLNSATRAIELEASIMINPEEPITEEITRITGITDADVAEAPNFAAVLPQLVGFFAQAAGVVAHNLPFDRAILRGELARAEVTEFPWPAKELCTVGLYAPLWGRNPKLVELYKELIGRPLAQTHRALDDCRALAEIFIQEELWLMIG